MLLTFLGKSWNLPDSGIKIISTVSNISKPSLVINKAALTVKDLHFGHRAKRRKSCSDSPLHCSTCKLFNFVLWLGQLLSSTHARVQSAVALTDLVAHSQTGKINYAGSTCGSFHWSSRFRAHINGHSLSAFDRWLEHKSNTSLQIPLSSTHCSTETEVHFYVSLDTPWPTEINYRSNVAFSFQMMQLALKQKNSIWRECSSTWALR